MLHTRGKLPFTIVTLAARVAMFLSAFSPLFAIWALRLWFGLATVAFLVLIALGLAGTLAAVAVAEGDEGDAFTVGAVEPRGADVAAYVVSYLVPFVTASPQSGQDWASIAIFVSLIFALYVTSDLISINPILALRGLRLYRVALDASQGAWMLSRVRIQAGQQITATPLIADVYVLVRVVT